MRIVITVEFETDFEDEDDIEAFTFGAALAENLGRMGFPFRVLSAASDIDETFIDDEGKRHTVRFR